MDNLSKIDLYENWKKASGGGCQVDRAADGAGRTGVVGGGHPQDFMFIS
jgi:hypothetical protein